MIEDEDRRGINPLLGVVHNNARTRALLALEEGRNYTETLMAYERLFRSLLALDEHINPRREARR